MSKTAAVCIDDWKLPVFEQHLKAAGYTHDGPFTFSSGVLVLKVHCEWLHKLRPVIEAAQTESARRKAELCHERD